MPSRVPTVRQRRLGAELRRLREGQGLTADEVADRLRWSPSKVSRMETAKIGARVSDVRLLLELYGLDESHLGEILALAQAAGQKGWWADYRSDLSESYEGYIALEDEADVVFCFEGALVPGLCQTEEYAREVLMGANVYATIPPSQIDRGVEVRLRRQELLTRAEPLSLSVILDESVLLRCVGDHEIMRRQIAHLIELAELPNVEIRTLPLAAPHQLVVSESILLLRFTPAYDVTFPDVAHIEGINAVQHLDEAVTYTYHLIWENLASQALGFPESMERFSQIADTRWRT
jgi:transcriptional regulator with XRE-family HTH domain